MKVYTYSQAGQNLSRVLNECKSQEVLIRRRGGEAFRVSPEPQRGSPLDVKPFRTRKKVATGDIIAAVREVRER